MLTIRLKTLSTSIAALCLLCSCESTNFGSPFNPSTQATPAEEIRINNANFNKPYKILGPVEYTLKNRPSLFTSQLDLREQAIEHLKQQTFARYGDEVDAIIDTRVEENTITDHEGNLSIVHIEGVAISFISGEAGADKASGKSFAKRKHTTAKKIMVLKKTKPVKKLPGGAFEKPAKTKPAEEDEIEISPQEILK
jgi:hypothetical protein